MYIYRVYLLPTPASTYLLTYYPCSKNFFFLHCKSLSFLLLRFALVIPFRCMSNKLGATAARTEPITGDTMQFQTSVATQLLGSKVRARQTAPQRRSDRPVEHPAPMQHAPTSCSLSAGPGAALQPAQVSIVRFGGPPWHWAA